jgi:serine/threonine protein kinase
VFKGTYKRTEVAIKVLHQSAVNNSNLREFMREVAVLMKLRHPNLVLFMGACVDHQLAIVMEYCRGDNLFKLLHECP